MTNRFRKKPIVVEAIRWTGGNQAELMRWAAAGAVPARWEFDGSTFFIQTKEGRMLASIGDWIIRGVAGEYYPCKPEIFAESYEPVDALAAQAPAAVTGDGERHVETLRAMRSVFESIPAPCDEREAIDAAITSLSRPAADGEAVVWQYRHRLENGEFTHWITVSHKPSWTPTEIRPLFTRPPAAATVPDAWLVVSEKAGKISAHHVEAEADAAVAQVVREYDDAYGYTRKLPLTIAAAPTAPAVDDKAVLDAIARESWRLDPFDMPTPGGDDANIGWRVIQYHRDEPRERVVAEVYEDDPRAAVRAALAKQAAHTEGE